MRGEKKDNEGKSPWKMAIKQRSGGRKEVVRGVT